MLTGSERTGWILHMCLVIKHTGFPSNPIRGRTLPEAVEVQVIRVKVQKGLLGIRGALGLKD